MNAEQPSQIKPLEQAVNDLYFALKSGELKLVDTQIEDFNSEAEKLDPVFTRNLPARGVTETNGGIVDDFKFLNYSLKNEFVNQFWGSFYVPEGVEDKGETNGLGYQAKKEGFMLICKPGKEINRANLAVVLVPRHYELVIDSLRQQYPDVRFIPVNEIKDLPQIVQE